MAPATVDRHHRVHGDAMSCRGFLMQGLEFRRGEPGVTLRMRVVEIADRLVRLRHRDIDRMHAIRVHAHALLDETLRRRTKSDDTQKPLAFLRLR